MADLTLSLAIATWYHLSWLTCVKSWRDDFFIVPEMDILPAYQCALEHLHEADVIGYVHDDLVCQEEGWKARVLAEFADHTVALVGFAGAPGHGHPQMYAQPYHHSSMGRVGFRSNMRDAERHGARFAGSCNVVVLDGMAFFVRRAVLAEAGGWPLSSPISYFQYMEWLCCMTRRLGYRIRLVGVACDHLNGRSTGLNPHLNPDFEGEHKYIYDTFADVLPAYVEP